MTDRSHWVVRVRHLHDDEPDDDLDHLTPAERIAMVWPLTVAVASLYYPHVTLDMKMRRDIVRLYRPGEPRPDEDELWEEGARLAEQKRQEQPPC